MSAPAELRSALPPDIDPARIRAAVRAPGSPGSFGGETWLVDLDGGLAVLTRGSIFDPLQPIVLSHEAPITQREGEVEIRPAAGAPFVVRPSYFETEAVAELLATSRGLATVERAPEFTDVAPAVVASPTPDPAGDEDLERAAAGAIERGEDQQALTLARRRLAQLSGAEATRWRDLVRVLELLEAGQLAPALLWGSASTELPYEVSDAVYVRLATALERAGEPVLAATALTELFDEDRGAALRARLAPQLPDDEQRARIYGQRAREFFAPLAHAGDPMAQRGLAQALLRLDEHDEALQWVARAKVQQPRDPFTRELETDILAHRAMLSDDPRDLRALREGLEARAGDFPDDPWPLRELADTYEHEDPSRAVELLHAALERSFSGLTLVDLVALLVANGRYDEAIGTVEDARARGHQDELDEWTQAELDKLLGTSRAALGLTTTSELTTRRRASGVPIVALLLVVLVGLALAWLGFVPM